MTKYLGIWVVSRFKTIYLYLFGYWVFYFLFLQNSVAFVHNDFIVVTILYILPLHFFMGESETSLNFLVMHKLSVFFIGHTILSSSVSMTSADYLWGQFFFATIVSGTLCILLFCQYI